MSSLTDTQYNNLQRNTLVMHQALSTRCVDCKLYWHPLVMTFDHVDRGLKWGAPSKLRTASPETFDIELKKCDVVCRNCHQIREYLRDKKTMRVVRNKENIYNYYASLIPYLYEGARLLKVAYKEVRVGWII